MGVHDAVSLVMLVGFTIGAIALHRIGNERHVLFTDAGSTCNFVKTPHFAADKQSCARILSLRL